MVKVWMYTDEFGSQALGTTPEDEYEEIEKWFIEKFPEKNFQFRRDVNPFELKNGRPDIYLFDIRGLCYVDHTGDKRRLDLCGEVLRQLEDHPGTLVIAWSNMTGDYCKSAIYDLFPDNDEETSDDLLSKYPNFVLREPKLTIESSQEKKFEGKVRSWFQ